MASGKAVGFVYKILITTRRERERERERESLSYISNIYRAGIHLLLRLS
jgi:hypothetical protein